MLLQLLLVEPVVAVMQVIASVEVVDQALMELVVLQMHNACHTANTESVVTAIKQVQVLECYNC